MADEPQLSRRSRPPSPDNPDAPVGDSKDPDRVALHYTPREWRAFLQGVHDGEFDPHHPVRGRPGVDTSQVWTWDITKIRGPGKGMWFHLYVLIDISSRYNPGWLLAAAEDSVLARDFIDEAIARNGQVPHTVRADRGTSMTSQPVSALLVNLGVTRTHSRPRVSNDNPLSEAQFKTLKYPHDFPESFPTLAVLNGRLDEGLRVTVGGS